MSEKNRKVQFRVVKVDRLLTKANKPYYDLLLQEHADLGGRQRSAKIWEDVLSTMQEKNLPKVGQVWIETGWRPNVFNGVEQLIISGYKVVPDPTPEEVSSLYEKLPIDPDCVLADMFRWKWWDEDIRYLMAGIEIFLQNDLQLWDNLKHIPAGASYHHSVRGGFLLHIDELLGIAHNMFGVMESPAVGSLEGSLRVPGIHYYEGLVDFQILRAGIVLHDIGKVHDYDPETLQYRSDPWSECLEHTLVAITWIDKFWKDFSPESVDRKLRLQHAIAAHHGKEMGAVVPKTPEAIILHHLDMISASLDVCRTAYRTVGKGLGKPTYSKMLGAAPVVPLFSQKSNSPVDPVSQSFMDKLVTGTVVEVEKPETVNTPATKPPWEE